MVYADFKDPILQLKGQECLYIENYKKLLNYTSEEIHILTRSGIIYINGAELMILYYSKEELEIHGLINRISFSESR